MNLKSVFSENKVDGKWGRKKIGEILCEMGVWSISQIG